MEQQPKRTTLSLNRKPRTDSDSTQKPREPREGTARKGLKIYKPATTNKFNKNKKIDKDGKQTGNFKGKPNGKKPFNKNGKKFKSKIPIKPLDYYRPLVKMVFEDFMEREDVKRSEEILTNLNAGRFNFDNPKLLAKGVRTALVAFAQQPQYKKLGYSNRLISKALQHYAISPKYVELYRVGAERFDLEGNMSSIVTQEEVNEANRQVAETRKAIKKTKSNIRKEAERQRKRKEQREKEAIENTVTEPVAEPKAE